MSRAPKSQLKQGKPYTSTPLHICMYSIVTIKHFWTRGLDIISAIVNSSESRSDVFRVTENFF